MEQLSTWLDDAVREGRAALNSLRTSNVDAKDLVEELRRALESPAKPASMNVSLAVNGNCREVHPLVLDELLRVGGEAIRNAFNHSAATRLEIALEYEHHFTMRITDNGVGMDPGVSQHGKPGHFGLPGMRERAASIGAYLTVHSSSAGTSIAMIVPGRIAFRHANAGIPPRR
jgi:signal transduction histidine kinase